ncbi:MAG: response regulator [Lachnospiraceae bacterium]|nr:response regulator [Lachnospiraceae bacterium]
MNIGEVIKFKRKKRNMTQVELAEVLKVTPQAVSRWEMGISYPDIAIIPLISEALRVTADELLGLMPMEPSSVGHEPRENHDPVLNQSQADSIFDYVPVPITGENRKVLIVDDSDFMRMMLEDILTHHGHTVLQAKGGQECLDLLQNETVDVCVLDIGMPGMDGMEVLQRIKKGQPGLKVVMLSALSQESNVRQALQLGADAFVVKPFGAECLVERVG